MPRKYRRNCDFCGTYYEGLGRRFCNPDCGNAHKRAPNEASPPQEPDETIYNELGAEGGNVYVPASQQIRTPEELMERSGINPDDWIWTPKVRTWPVAMKINDEVVVTQLHYVAITFRQKLEDSWDIKPLEIVVKRPKLRKRGGGQYYTTVMYSDLHYPYMDPAALHILYSIMDDLSPELVVCLGDLIDCEQLMSYPKNPYRRTSLADEIRMGAEHLGEVDSIVPSYADRWLLEGNHEERLRRVVWKAAEDRRLGELIELAGVREALRWENLLGLDKMGWQFTPYPKFRLLRDRLLIIHGDKVRPKSAATAMVHHDRFRKSGMSGHTHRLGSYYHTGHDGQVQAWHETGMIGKIRDDYTGTIPNWQQGFIVTQWDGDRYGVEHVGIHEGRAFFRGRSYGSEQAEEMVA